MSSAIVSQLGSILTIWAHPDDETSMIGGILAEAARANQHVVCVTATKGEAGVQDESRWPAATLGEVRANELKAALAILGTPEHHWLDYPDGDCAAIREEEAVARIKAFIEKYNPDSIITFGPDGLTGHPDHQAVSRWTTTAVGQLSQQPRLYHAVHTTELYSQVFSALDARLNIYFNVDVPVLVPAKQCDMFIQLPNETIATKLRALQAMPSQYEAFFAQCTDEEMILAFGCEALICAK